MKGPRLAGKLTPERRELSYRDRWNSLLCRKVRWKDRNKHDPVYLVVGYTSLLGGNVYDFDISCLPRSLTRPEDLERRIDELNIRSTGHSQLEHSCMPYLV